MTLNTKVRKNSEKDYDIVDKIEDFFKKNNLNYYSITEEHKGTTTFLNLSVTLKLTD